MNEIPAEQATPRMYEFDTAFPWTESPPEWKPPVDDLRVRIDISNCRDPATTGLSKAEKDRGARRVKHATAAWHAMGDEAQKSVAAAEKTLSLGERLAAADSTFSGHRAAIQGGGEPLEAQVKAIRELILSPAGTAAKGKLAAAAAAASIQKGATG